MKILEGQEGEVARYNLLEQAALKRGRSEPVADISGAAVTGRLDRRQEEVLWARGSAYTPEGTFNYLFKLALLELERNIAERVLGKLIVHEAEQCAIESSFNRDKDDGYYDDL